MLNDIEFDKLLEENYVEDSSDMVEFKHNGQSYITESLDEDDLDFLNILNELD